VSASEIVVERSGPSAIVVDRGRFGFLAIGVAWCGAADLVAFTIANRLAGNDGGAAAIEMTFGGAAFTFSSAARFALAGADCRATLNGDAIASWAAYYAPSGAELVLHAPRRGVRSVLAVHGGIDVPIVMGSRTTDLAARIGGFEGRPLARGDRLPVGSVEDVPFAGTLRVKPPDWDAARGDGVEIAVIPGGEWTYVPGEARERFWNTRWRVNAQSNRRACMLEGEPLPLGSMPELRSHGIVPGVVQLPSSGLPIVLSCDAQTTGGYPKAGVVAEADLWKCAQLEPGVLVRFVPATIESAAKATHEIEEYVATIDRALRQAQDRPRSESQSDEEQTT
jgi:5-oxoprolinase (ATP-hydrolysing) subunit C